MELRNILSLARRSFDLVRARRALWLFGFFTFTAGGSGIKLNTGHAAPLAAGTHALPGWVLPLVLLGSLLSLAYLAMHMISEGALIDAVPRAEAGEPTPIRAGMRAGARSAWRILGIKLAAFAVMLVVALGIAVPTLVALIAHAPIWAAVIPIVPLVFVAIPVFLTVHVLQLLALRAAVLERRGVVDAFRAAYEWLHGRVADTLLVLVTEGAGTFVASLAVALAAMILALPGLALWLAFGPIAAAIGVAVLVAPLGIVFTGAIGAWKSSLWTMFFLDAGKAA